MAPASIPLSDTRIVYSIHHRHTVLPSAAKSGDGEFASPRWDSRLRMFGRWGCLCVCVCVCDASEQCAAQSVVNTRPAGRMRMWFFVLCPELIIFLRNSDNFANTNLKLQTTYNKRKIHTTVELNIDKDQNVNPVFDAVFWFEQCN